MESAVKLDELEPWLKDALRVQIANVNKAIKKAKTDVDSQISSLREVTADLAAKSEKDESEKRNDRAMYKAAKSVSRMCLELQRLLVVNPPVDPHSYEGLRQFSDATAKLASNAAMVRDRWIGHIRPYYILDTMSLNASIDKLRRLGEQAWSLLSKDGNLLRRLEEIHARVEKTRELVKSLEKQSDEFGHMAEEASSLRPRISDAEHQMESVASNPKIADLRKIDNRLRELRAELLSSGFRRLGRPLRKLEAMAGRGEYSMVPEIRERLSEYLRRPFTTFIHEDDGYPHLKSVLIDMRRSVDLKKLLLKQREERKVLERIENVVEKNTLNGIHHEATMLLNERRRYLHDPECRELVTAYKQRKLDLNKLRSEHEDLEHRSKLLSDKVELLRSSLAQFTRETEKLAERLSGKPIKVELDHGALSA
jgi:Fe-S cluster biosynthesis and repair protein YggX/uncharacterized protein YdcH (DUF465 family)